MHCSTALQKRLLHPGASTIDIITQYVATIKVLRIIDPSEIILDVVCEPVRAYLRQREDTVRCIVSGLIDDSNNELFGEVSNVVRTMSSCQCYLELLISLRN